MRRLQLTQPLLLEGADLLTGGKALRSSSVLVARGKIIATGHKASRVGRKHGARRVDASGFHLAPGFVDLHTHGAVGVDFVEAGPGDFARAIRFYLSRGVTTLLVSLYPSSFKKSLQVLSRVSGFLREGLGEGAAVGIHLEGPFLSSARPGALPSSSFRRFRATEADALLEAGGGFVRTMTIAPEREGGRGAIRHLMKRGVVPAFGHSDAGYSETCASIAGGIRYATHLFNAMRGIHHRDPGAVTALLEDPRVSVELIADGFHVSVPVLRLVHAVKPRDRVVLVSDSVHPCGLRPGRYRFAGKSVRAAGGRVTLLDGTLAGSLLTLDHAVALHVEQVGLSPAESVQLATSNPARVIGLERTRGSLAPGRRADLVLLDSRLRVKATWLAGKQVFGEIPGS